MRGSPSTGFGGIVGMHTHVDAIFVAYGHYSFEKILHVGTQLLLVDTLIEFQQIAEFADGVEVGLRKVAAYKSLGLDYYIFDKLLLFFRELGGP